MLTIGNNSSIGAATIGAANLTLGGGTLGTLAVKNGGTFTIAGSVTSQGEMQIGGGALGADAVSTTCSLVAQPGSTFVLASTSSSGIDVGSYLKSGTATCDFTNAASVNITAPYLSIGGNANVSGSGATGIVILSTGSNTINATGNGVNVGELDTANNTSAVQTLELNGNTTITTSAVRVGGPGQSGYVYFANPGTLKLTATAGGLYVGDNADAAAGGTENFVSSGTMDVTNGTFNATLGTLAVGYCTTNNSAGGAIGVFSLGAGSVTANTVILGQSAGTANLAAYVAGTINLEGGSLVVGNALNPGVLSQGTTRSKSTSTLNLEGGLLNMNGGTIAVSSFNATSGTLMNVSAIQTVAGATAALSVSGNGLLVLDGTDTYPARHDSHAGTLTVAPTGMRIDSASTGTALTINGANAVMNVAGVYNKTSNSSAVIENGGLLNVSGSMTWGVPNGTGSIQVGDNSTGTLSISGGSLTIAAKGNNYALQIGYDSPGNTGVVNVTNGLLAVTGSAGIYVGGANTTGTNSNTGILNINNGGVVQINQRRGVPSWLR